MWRWIKPQRPEVVTLAVAVFIVAALNAPFWVRLYEQIAPASTRDWLFLASVAVTLVLILNLMLLAVSRRWLLASVLSVLLPVTAAASYFMTEYGVVIDANMVRNVFETDPGEAGDLITGKLALYCVLLGALPALLVWLVPWQRRPFAFDLKAKLTAAVASLACIALATLPFWGDYLSVFRADRYLKLTLTPSNYIAAFVKYARKSDGKAPVAVAAIGTDATRMWEPAARPHVFVIVVGETARADHFGINGYKRDTTPELAKLTDIQNYPRAYSCGTDTAQSVPCMFSGLKRADFSNAKAAARENLLDILKHANVDVLWRDNQAGCKGVCERVPSEAVNVLADVAASDPSHADHAESYDGKLLDGLEARIASATRDTVIVLHMMGSHGPAYWKRYPQAFAAFNPPCQHSQFSHCTSDEIINAYDNSIRYTDHILAELIALLRSAGERGVDTGMIYVSDHGESLGEHSIYLHGMPYAIAPDEQVHVPMLSWLSPGLMQDNAITADCLAEQARKTVSHDNLFHTVIGIMDIETTAYDRSLDIFAACSHHPS